MKFSFGATILEFNGITSPFLLFLFCYFFTVSISAIICFKRFDRFLPFEPLKINTFDELRKRHFSQFLPVVIYLSEFVGIQSQSTSYDKLLHNSCYGNE